MDPLDTVEQTIQARKYSVIRFSPETHATLSPTTVYIGTTVRQPEWEEAHHDLAIRIGLAQTHSPQVEQLKKENEELRFILAYKVEALFQEFLSRQMLARKQWIFGPEEEQARVQEVIQLLDEWMADESGYEEEYWPQIEEGLDRDRLSSRKLYPDE